MSRDLKMLPSIDIFVIVINGNERFKNADIIQNLNIYEQLFGGKLVWKHVIVALTRLDYNPY